MAAIRRLLSNQRGVSAIEYALLAALIALSIVSALGELGTSVGEGLASAEDALPASVDGDGVDSGGNGGGKGKGKGKDKPKKN